MSIKQLHPALKMVLATSEAAADNAFLTDLKDFYMNTNRPKRL